MTRQEFGQWLNRLKEAFPAVDRFFTREDPEAAANVFTRWLDVMHSTDTETADKAITALVSGEIEAPTYLDDWAKLPAIVRRWCREHQSLQLSEPQYTAQKTYACRRCWDKGYGVEVFNPTWIRYHSAEIELGELPTGWQREARRWCTDQGAGPHTFSVHCDCSKGERMASVRRQPVIRFDEKLHCEVPPGGERHWAEHLSKWIIEHPVLEANTWTP